MTDAPLPPAAAPLARTRPFYWSVRRELWENRAIYLAPLAVAGVVLFGFLFSLRNLPHAARIMAAGKPQPGASPAEILDYGRSMMALQVPQLAVGAVLVAGLIVAIFYCLGALHNERRDRSVLFWKSLPVSDWTAVLSKAFVPLAVLPPILFVVMTLTHGLTLGVAGAVIAGGGQDPAVLWRNLPPPGVDMACLAYGLVMLSLWYAPIVGWLLMVSAWSRKLPFLWALAPPLVACLLELMIFHTHTVWTFLNSRLVGGLAAFTANGEGKAPVRELSQINPMPFLTDPGFWGGLVFAAAALAACAWLRRRRDPI